MWWRKLSVLFLVTAGYSGAGTIHLKTRTIETVQEPSGLSSVLERRIDGTRQHEIVEFQSPINAALLAELTARGVLVTSSLSAHALMLSINDMSLLRGLDVTWMGQLLPEDKLSPQLDNPSIHLAGWVVEFHKDVAPNAVSQILRRNGFTSVPSSALLPNQRIVRGDRAALSGLADWDEVAYIFPASAALVSGSGVQPCSGALTTGGNTADYVLESSGWTLNGTNGLTLTYVFTNLTSLVPAAQVQSEIIRAMRQWSAVTNVQFVLGTDPAAPWTVAIEFGATVNNDPQPFTSANVLAHTYYPAPPNPEPIAGDLHFNPAENWHVGASTDVYTVALHELGHALGLGHTDNPADIMYPYYQFGAELSPDDIAGVQALYGVVGSPIVTPQPLQAPFLLSISSPLTGSRTNAESVTVSGALSNASSAAAVSWQSSGGQSGQASGATSWTASVPLSPGVNLVTLTATDIGQLPITRVVRILCAGAGGASPSPSSPSTPASLVITSTSGESALTVSGAASDPAGIAQITWQTNSGASGIALGTTSWTAQSIPVYPGDNVIVIRSYNNNGQMTWISATISR